MIKVIIHGGAGAWDKHPEKEQVLQEVGEYAQSLIKENSSIADIAEKVVNFMENDPRLNAGLGSALTSQGTVEVDACFCISSTPMQSGAVGSLVGIKHPISVARIVMQETPHELLVGQGALDFSLSKGFVQEDLRTEKRIKEFEAAKEGFGTVGCVVTDGSIIVAATSTGGTPNKMPGRVGDTAIIGAGTYATQKAGISCTGKGEVALQFGLARRIAENPIQRKELLAELTERYGSSNTAYIGVTIEGEFIVDKNTEKFGYATASEEEVHVHIIA